MVAAAPGGDSRQALAAGIACYVLWSGMPLLFLAMTGVGATSLEIVGQRAMWSAPWAILLVVLAGQHGEAIAAFRKPRVLGWLTLSTALLTGNWLVFVWASTHGHNIDASLGYFIIPLINMAVGAVFYREKISRLAVAAMVLAVIGVVLQILIVGHIPWIGLALAFCFGGYGLVRKHVAINAQAGLLVESLIIAVPGAAYCLWLYVSGTGVFGRGVSASLLLAAAGPATVIPLALFAWAARRLPLASLGFLQFIGPTTGFGIGLALGESFHASQLLSFSFIWAGVAAFIWEAFIDRRGQAQAMRLIRTPDPAKRRAI